MASTEEKVRVASRISKELDVRVRQFYSTSSSAIPEALELLASSKEVPDVKDDATKKEFDVKKNDPDVKGDEHGVNNDVIKKEFDDSLTSAQITEMQGRIEEYKAQVQSLNSEISRLKTVIMEAPDPVDLVRLQERNDGLNLLLGEKEKRIIELTQYKEDIGAFANYFKSKSPELIEAPAAEKKKPWYKFW